MVRISLTSTGRGLALLLLIGLGGLTPFQPVAALAEEDQAGKPRQAAPAEGEDPKEEAGEPEPEFELIQTPFGTIRQPRSETRPDAPRADADPAETGESAPASGEAAASDPEGTLDPEPDSEPATPEGRQASGRSGPNTRFRFNCVECNLLEFVRNIANELKLNYVVDPNVEGVVNILTYGEMRRSDLMSLLETVLQINGAAMVKTGPVYRILASRSAKRLPLDIRRDPGSAGGDMRVIQIVPLNFVSAADMAELLTPYLSGGGDITFHQAANFLIITDAPSNLGKLLELVQVFDSDVFGGKRVRVYALENSRATSLVEELESIFSGYALSGESPLRFIPIPRLNSVLAISPSTGSLEEIDRWIAQLDQAGLNREIRNYFVKVQNGQAREIASLLLEIYGRRDRSRLESLLPLGGQTETSQGGDAGPATSSAQVVQGEIKIVADEQNNAIIIQCSPQDFEVIEETIRELDRVPRQVLINVKIYEVVLDDELSMGVTAFLQDRSNPVVPSPTTTTANTGGGGAVAAGLNLATQALVGNTRELVAFLNAAETRRRSRVLSAPSVIASDNVPARIQVGSQIPILTSQGVVPGGTGGSSLFSNTIQNRNTGVILNVTPRINAGGWVTLEVEQEVSSPGAPPVGGIQSPTINIRSVNTQVTVKNAQTIAIGGIISETNGRSRNGVPFLSRIPGLGLLFGSTSKKTSRTELIALITPHVIEDIEQASDLTEELKSTLKGLKKELRKAES